MKICWDTIQNIRLTKGGNFFRNGQICYEIESCLTCGEPFLGNRGSKYCTKKCAYADEERTKAIILKIKGRTFSNEHKLKLSIAAQKGEKCRLWKGGYSSSGIPTYDTYASRLLPYEECKRNEHDPNILEVKCTYCGKWFFPSRKQVGSRIYGIDNNNTGRFYCSPSCKEECPIYSKSGNIKQYKGHQGCDSREVQPELRRLVFARDNYTCQKCGSDGYLHCHHIDPVVSNPIESADMDNCITLCKECHKWCHMNIDGCGYGELANCL